MDLTDEQWQLIEPILPTPTPTPAPEPAPGRPPQDARAILNGILWKIRTGNAWDDLPDVYPSHQTCYRYYCAWNKSEVLKAIVAALAKDLVVRGGLDIRSALHNGDIRPSIAARKIRIEFAPRLQDTWRASTALLLFQFQLMIKRAAKKSKQGRSTTSISGL